MRFLEKGLTIEEVVELINYCFESGINTHHSSFEYESYGLYLSALAKSEYKNQIKHIVKLSCPSFDDNRFSSRDIEDMVDKELNNLQIDNIEVLQWLVRSKPIEDESRIAIVQDQHQEIKHTFDMLKSKGKINFVYSFPYSVKFAHEVNRIDLVDGMLTYLNIKEKEYEEFARNGFFIAIRPFFARELLLKYSVKECMDFVLSHPGVLSVITGINGKDQLANLKEYLN